MHASCSDWLKYVDLTRCHPTCSVGKGLPGVANIYWKVQGSISHCYTEIPSTAVQHIRSLFGPSLVQIPLAYSQPLFCKIYFWHTSHRQHAHHSSWRTVLVRFNIAWWVRILLEAWRCRYFCGSLCSVVMHRQKLATGRSQASYRVACVSQL
jgi:hypothetical protein